ncbi:MAG: signal peptidase I [Planctomycetota bacterium]
MSDVSTSPQPEASTAPAQARKHSGGIKELVENMLIAFVLAFMFRCFVVEAFVIPTGSMAPTLLGAHMRFTDPDSGYRWITNYSAAGDINGQLIIPKTAVVVGQDGRGQNQVLPIISPNTLYRVPPIIEGDPDNDATAPPIHYGDRILVQKYIYILREPARWDVIVFKNPDIDKSGAEPYQQNYIKRLIGLPGETVMILDGDIYVADTPTPTAADYVIQTKPKKVQDALWRIVYDHDFKSQGLPRDIRRTDGKALGISDPAFVNPWSDLSGAWDLEAGPDGRAMSIGASDGRATLRFDPDRNGIIDAQLARNGIIGSRLLAPMFTDWLAADVTLNSPATKQQASRRSATYPYTHTDGYRPLDEDVLATGGKLLSGRVKSAGDPLVNVRDVMLEFDALTNGGGDLELMVSRRDVVFTITVTADSTSMTMQRGDNPASVIASSDRGIPNGNWTYVELASVDHQVTLRLDGKVVLQTTPDEYAPDVQALLDEYIAMQQDDFDGEKPAKARLALTADGIDAELRHVKVWRDVYYLTGPSMIWGMPTADGAPDRPQGLGVQPKTPIVLGPDEFFTLGDNSLLSGDSRYWNNPVELKAEGLSVEPGRVPRRFILGKAFFVYWPAGHRPVENLPSIVPNFGEMRFIH